MTLRDLVWRVDMFRELITQGAAVEDTIELLDTDDIHAFLRQEPLDPQ